MRFARCALGCLPAVALALWTTAAAAAGCTAPPPEAAITAPQLPGWTDYQIIMWQDQTPARRAGLARLGVTAGTIHGTRGPIDHVDIPAETAPFCALQQRFYIENIATDFYSAYHRWFPNHPVTWLFDQAKSLHRQDPATVAAFIRYPSLSDPAWLRRIADRLRQHVAAYRAYHPLFYNLADEAGIADLAAAWDFDFAPQSLAGMRVWLRRHYGTLAALNREWGSHFADWDAVMPMTTDAALKQPDENFAAWADFKAWMDVAFARAVRTGTDAVHAADPTARAALEGTQVPGWGGYDYSRLAGSVDVMEMYDYGNSVEIARSLNPRLITLQTSSLADPQQIATVWREVLLGGDGLILWDADNAFVGDDGAPSARGRTLAALAGELRSGLAAQLIASTPAVDPVAILYSPASARTQWLLDRKADGKPWAERKAETEYDEDNPVRRATRRIAGMLTHLGVRPHWLTRGLIEQGALARDRIRVLALPHAIALSPGEVKQIRRFVAAGGVVMADTAPGGFDQHSRRLPHPALADLAGPAGPIIAAPEWQRDGADDPAALERLRQRLVASGAGPRFTLSTADGRPAIGTEARVFDAGPVTIVGLQRDAAAGDDKVVLTLPAPAEIYDLRHPGTPQRTAQVTLALDPVAPTVLALAPAPLPALTLHGPARTQPGAAATFAITSGATAAGPRVVHVTAIAPGASAPVATRNLALGPAGLQWRLHLAAGAVAGTWTIRVTDVLSGHISESRLTVGAGTAAASGG